MPRHGLTRLICGCCYRAKVCQFDILVKRPLTSTDRGLGKRAPVFWIDVETAEILLPRAIPGRRPHPDPRQRFKWRRVVSPLGANSTREASQQGELCISWI